MRGTIEKILAPYVVTRPIRRIRKLSDEEIENGLLWVSDAVTERYSQVGAVCPASQHFADVVLPEKFWLGVNEERAGMTEG